MGQKSKFLVKHGLAVNTQSGTTLTLNYPTADGANQQYLRTDGQGNLQFDSPGGGGGGGTFLSLGDTPATYAGAPGRVLVVNDSGNGLTLSASPLNNSQSRFEFTGDGTTVNFVTGTTQFTTVDHILVYVDGVIQAPTTNFTLDSTVITFTSAPANNADILVFGTVTASGFPQGLIDSDALTNPLGLRGRLNAGGHIVPKVDSAYDLGDSALKWRDLYMSGSTIHLGGVTIKSDGTGVVLPANSKIGNRRFGGSRQDSAEKGFDSDLKGTYGSTTAIPILKIDSAGFIDSVGTASITSDLVGDTSPQLGGDLDVDSYNISGLKNMDWVNVRLTDSDRHGGATPISQGKLIIEQTNAPSHQQSGPTLVLRNMGKSMSRVTQEDSATQAQISFSGYDSSGGSTNWAMLRAVAGTAAASTKKGEMWLYLAQHNAISPNYKFTPDHLYLGRGYHSSKQVSIKFEGDSNNEFETELTVDNPTADRTITLPDATGTVVTKSVYTGGGHDPSAQLISLKATNNQGTGNLQIAAQGATLLAAQTDTSAIYSNPTNNGFFTFSDLHIRAGGILHVDAGPGGAEFNTDILLETGHTLSFEGSTVDSFETTLTVVDPTADRTIKLPDSAGNVVLKDSNGRMNLLWSSGQPNISGSKGVGLNIGAFGEDYFGGSYPHLHKQHATVAAMYRGTVGDSDRAELWLDGGLGHRVRVTSDLYMSTNKDLEWSKYGDANIKFNKNLWIRDSNADENTNTDVYIRSQRDQDRGPVVLNMWKDIPSPDSGEIVAQITHIGTDVAGSGFQAPYSYQFTEIRDTNYLSNADSSRGRYGRYEFQLPLSGPKFRTYSSTHHQHSVDWQSAEAKKIGNVGHAWGSSGSIPLRMDWNKVNVPHNLNVGMDSSIDPTERFVVQGVDTRRLTFGDSCLTVTTSTATSNIDDANVARFRKGDGALNGLDVLVYKDGNGHSSGIATNINETAAGGVSLQDNTYIGLMYFQDNRSGSQSHNFSALDTNGSTYRVPLSLKGDSTMEATFGGKVILPAAGVQFSDGTSQTTAASGSGSASAATVYAYNMIFN